VRVHAYDPSYAGGIGKGIEVQDWPLAKTWDHNLKKN
jgi:hypothetical protein